MPKSYNAPVRRPRPEPTDAERWERLSPRELALGTHLDVHGLRKQLLEAIGSVEQSQTRMLSLVANEFLKLNGKIDKLGTGGGPTPEELAGLSGLLVEGEAIATRLEALNAQR